MTGTIYCIAEKKVTEKKAVKESRLSFFAVKIVKGSIRPSREVVLLKL